MIDVSQPQDWTESLVGEYNQFFQVARDRKDEMRDAPSSTEFLRGIFRETITSWTKAELVMLLHMWRLDNGFLGEQLKASADTAHARITQQIPPEQIAGYTANTTADILNCLDWERIPVEMRKDDSLYQEVKRMFDR